VLTRFDDSVGESTTSGMKKGDLSTNVSDFNKNNIMKPTLDHLSEEDRKALEPYHKVVDEIFLSRYEVTMQTLIQRDSMLINIHKSEVTPEIRSNLSLSFVDVQVMINYALERQVENSNEMMPRLIEERDGKKFVDSNVNGSSSCDVNFAQTNHQSSGTSASITSELNSSASPMNHFYSRITIDGSTPTCGIPQQTMTSTFGQGYTPAPSSFSMPNPGLTPIYLRV
jgi:hypothetical protein